MILPATLTAAPVQAAVNPPATAAYWGSFSHGSDEQTAPAPVNLPGQVAEVATSNSAVYVLLTDGSLYAMGEGTDGQLGDGERANSFTRPVQVRFPAGVTIASIPTDVMPYNTGLAVDTSGHVWGWGLNASGELCLGNDAIQDTPVELPFSHVIALAGAGEHALYDSAGTVYACGSGRDGDLGDGSDQSSSRPVRVAGLGRDAVSALVASWGDSGALLSNGSYLDWGLNNLGQLGDGSTQDSALPVQVPLPGSVSEVAQGGSLPGNGQTLALLSDGALRAWGDNRQYQLGVRGSRWELSPVPFSPPDGVTYRTLATSGTTSYAISTGGDVYAWGDGSEGQLGDRSTETSSSPVYVTSGAAEISATAGDVAVRLVQTYPG